VHLERGREEVLSTLLRIPEIILQAEHRLENFRNDPALYDRAEELYVKVLFALESIVDWLKQKPLGVSSFLTLIGRLLTSR
jgi:hypothetical protein